MNDYYLAILWEKLFVPMHISTEIIPYNRCVSIHELFNRTRAYAHLLKRIKYYHFLCEKRLELVCFYDFTLMIAVDTTYVKMKVNAFKMS